jgi:23S rRNA pseudouridine1911/1915/1917 synthase
MLFARSRTVQSHLKDQFRVHSTGRFYLALAHGRVHPGTLSFRLVRDRGDGIRGVTKTPHQGTHSVTHVTVREHFDRCTLIQCKLETGRTHQIRIHLSEVGHPLVGEPLYTKDFRGALIDSPRTLLHAAFLSFEHPITRQRRSFEVPLPSAFEDVLRRERSRRTP